MAELLNRLCWTQWPPAGEMGKGMVRKMTPVSAVMMTVLLLLVCCDGVVANTATTDATYSLSGHVSTSTLETNYSGPSGQVPSAALHLSGGGNIKVAPKETKAKKIVRKFLSKSGTFVLRRTRNNEQPSVGQDTRPHQPHYSVTHRQWHQNPSQQNLYEAQPPSVVLNYAHKNTALVSASHDCYVTKPTMPDSVSQQLSSKALVFMGLLALQFGVQPLLVRKFTSQGIIKSSIVLTQESIKFLVAAFLYLSGSNEQQRRRERAGKPISFMSRNTDKNHHGTASSCSPEMAIQFMPPIFLQIIFLHIWH
mmetsp:Transcript_904/g.1445  ORF Transcript_904/g.1445 Transcript_904/m.1445 type:complete len:308 (+) Transcript_904:168-1091(+)